MGKSTHRMVGRILSAFAALSLLLAAVGPSAAQSAGVFDLFGPRVTAVAGLNTPLLHGDYDGDGKPDAVYFVEIAPGGPGKDVSSDVHTVSLYDSQAINAQSSGHGVAIVLKDGAQKYLVTDFEQGATGFFDSPSWADVKAWGTSPPLHSARRNAAELKTNGPA